MNRDKDNPWLGLRSYQEGEIIYGRAEDIERLSQCILSHTQTVLYGRSGIGKTSILNAGIFPLVRKKGFFPVSIRLDHNPNALPYASQISKGVLSGISHLRKDSYDELGNIVTTFNKGTIHERVKALGVNESLWEFFHRYEFYNAEGQRIKPLIVLDQFEEIFTLGKDKDKVRLFFSELADLLNGVMPDYISKSAEVHTEVDRVPENNLQDALAPELIDFNLLQDDFKDYLESSDFHLIISLREDYLSYLERECGHIPSLRQNKFCLQPINEKQAAIIIMNPIRGLVEQDVAELIIKKVTGENIDLEGPPSISVDSAILSLYLRKLYDRLGENETQISSSLVESEGENIISGFYLESVSDIPESIVEYLEDTLVNGEGCRENISVYNAKKNIWGILQSDPLRTKSDVSVILNKLIDERKLLRKFDYGGGSRIEFIHDILCPVIVNIKEQRDAIRKQGIIAQENKEEAQRLAEIKKKLSESKRRNKRVTMILASAALFLCIVGLVIAMMGIRNKRQSNELRTLNNEINSILPSVIEQRILDGDSNSAGSLLLRLFPDTLYKYGDPTRTTLLRELSHNHSSLLQGHTQSVNTVSFSHNGKYAITGSNDMTLKLWDVSAGTILSSNSDSRNAILSASWNKDDSKIVYSTRDGFIRTCTVQNSRLQLLDSIELKDTYARFVTFNPTGTEIVVCCIDGSIRVLDTNGLVEKDSYRISRSGATYVSYSPDGLLMAIATGSNNTITVKRLSDNSTIATLNGHTDWVRSVEFSPDGVSLVSTSDDRTVRVWNLVSRKSTILGVLPNWGTKAAFTPEGSRIVCSSRDGILRTYDLRTANEIPEFQIKHQGYLNSFDISSDGKRVICGSTDPLVHVWDCGDCTDTGLSFHLDGAVYGLSCFKSSTRIAAASNKGTISVWDLSTRTPVFSKSVGNGDNGRFETLDISPDGSLIALAARFRIRLFSGIDGEEVDIDNSNGHHAWIRSICFNHKGSLLASVGEDGKAIIWDIAQKKVLRSIVVGSDGLYSVSFSHDDKTLITGDVSGVIRQWEVETGKPKGNPITGHTGVVLSLHFNHDDSLILSSSGDQTASIWKTDGSLVRQFVGASGYMNDAVFSHYEDEIITASADRYIRIWCVSNGKETARLIGHFGAVSNLDWSDNDTLVSSDMLGDIKIWIVQDLKTFASVLSSPTSSY